MKIIIAPSKTMKYKDYGFISSKQLFPTQTQYLLSILKEYNDEQLCDLMKISYKQALKVYDYYHQPQTSHPALSLYQGTVFKQLDINLYASHMQYLQDHVCILSALYGVLHYNTAITPYRLDMTMKPGHVNLYEHWYTPLYKYFENEDVIISLASQEFTSMIHHPELYFIDFIEIENDKIKRNAMIIKKARGQMLNQMILKEIHSLEQLKQLHIDGFQYNHPLSQDHTLVFSRKK